MEEICEELLAGGDSDVFLVALAEQIQESDQQSLELSANTVAKKLLQEPYKPILSRFGWDLLVLFTPHLHPSHPHSWHLVQQITTVCSPKEMVLAVLEQMESLSAKKPLLVFMMLDLLRKVMDRLTVSSGAVVDSTLRSVFNLLKPLLLLSNYEKQSRRCSEGRRTHDRDNVQNKIEGGDLEIKEMKVEGGMIEVDGGGGGETKVEDGESGKTNVGGGESGENKMDTMVEGGESEMETKVEGRETGETKVEGKESGETKCREIGKNGMDSGEKEETMEESSAMKADSSKSESEEMSLLCGISVIEAARRTLMFVAPFSEQVHKVYVESNGGEWGWTVRQRECIAMLLSLLGYPLVRKTLSLVRKPPSTSTTTTVGAARKVAEDIMSLLACSHCGCVSLLAWTPPKATSLDHSHEDSLSDEDDRLVSLPAVGVACFAYLMFSEGVEQSYLPLVYDSGYLFHTAVRHSTTLLGRQEDGVVKKGLKLLEALLARLPDHSLPPHLLDDKMYVEIGQTLVSLMTLSQLKSIRQTSVKLFQDIIMKFQASGRHRYYRSLLCQVSHSGVKGLLVHAVKNEVDSALKEVEDGGRSVFLGQGLLSLLELVMRVDEKMELLKEFDCLMSMLNFLRYMLIRDKPLSNQTGIWDMPHLLTANFISPLRSLLRETRARCRNELLVKRDKAKSSSRHGIHGQGGEPEVTVEVANESSLPEPSLQDEIEMLQVAEQQMDMMESVIVRVEELITSTQ